MANLLAIYNLILTGIPAKWFDQTNLAQTGAGGTNTSLIGSLLWTSTREIGTLTDQVNAFYPATRATTATGSNLDVVLTSRYGIKRNTSEGDGPYYGRVSTTVASKKKTKAAISAAVETNLGYPPLDIIEGAKDGMFFDQDFWDNQYATRQGRGDLIVAVAGPLTTTQIANLSNALIGVMPGVNTLIEVR